MRTTEEEDVLQIHWQPGPFPDVAVSDTGCTVHFILGRAARDAFLESQAAASRPASHRTRKKSKYRLYPTLSN